MKKIIAISAVGALALASACTPSEKDGREAGDQLEVYRNSQPQNRFGWSQKRQTLLDAQSIEAKGVQTTSFFFSRGAGGAGAPVSVCPSLGFPVPVTSQITQGAVIESTGLYIGNSDATYVICIDGKGKKYLAYSEGDVISVAGPAEWKDGRITLVGDPSAEVTGRPAGK